MNLDPSGNERPSSSLRILKDRTMSHIVSALRTLRRETEVFFQVPFVDKGLIFLESRQAIRARRERQRHPFS